MTLKFSKNKSIHKIIHNNYKGRDIKIQATIRALTEDDKIQVLWVEAGALPENRYLSVNQIGTHLVLLLKIALGGAWKNYWALYALQVA